MKVSYNWLQSYFDKKLLAPDKLAELLSAHAFEVEGMEKAPADTTLDIKVLPDRAHYALSHKGIAGEVAAITKTALKAPISPKIAITASVPKVAVNASDAKICPRYMARRIDGVHTAESPKWLRDYLEAIGQRSINSVVDSTNIVMFDLGQPLHAFDADKVQGAITVRKAKAGESIELLPEKTTVDGEIVFKERSFVLSESDIIIADDIGPLVIAGVKGGKRAEVSESTKSIIIEAAASLISLG